MHWFYQFFEGKLNFLKLLLIKVDEMFPFKIAKILCLQESLIFLEWTFAENLFFLGCKTCQSEIPDLSMLEEVVRLPPILQRGFKSNLVHTWSRKKCNSILIAFSKYCILGQMGILRFFQLELPAMLLNFSQRRYLTFDIVPTCAKSTHTS